MCNHTFHDTWSIIYAVQFASKIILVFINWQFSAVFAATAKSRPPHPACLHFMASTTSRGVVHHILPTISRSPESLDAHYLSYNNIPSYWYAPNLSVPMHTINIWQREWSHSTHKVPKRRRLAPSWDVVDDRPLHQLVHGEIEVNSWHIDVRKHPLPGKEFHVSSTIYSCYNMFF